MVIPSKAGMLSHPLYKAANDHCWVAIINYRVLAFYREGVMLQKVAPKRYDEELEKKHSELKAAK